MQVSEVRAEDSLGWTRDQRCNQRRDDRPEQGEQQPDAESGKRSGRWGAKHDREEQGNRQPYAAIGNRRREKTKHTHHFLGIGRQAEKQQAEADRQQPQREQADRERDQPCKKFPEQQRVTVDRLRQYPAHRAPAEFPVYRIEADGNRHQWDQKSEQSNERGERILRHREQPKEEKR